MHDIQELTAKQRAVYNAFWEAVRDGEECGAKALAEKVGRTTGSVSSNLQSLRSLGVIPTRPAHSREIPEDWRLQIPAEFFDGKKPAEAPKKPTINASQIPAKSDPESDLSQQLLAKLQKRKDQTLGVDQLADEMDVSPRRVREAAEQLEGSGYNVFVDGDAVALTREDEPSNNTAIQTSKEQRIRFGVISDTHLGSKNERLDVLAALYDWYAEEGIETVYHAGNWIEGCSRFNIRDRHKHGLDEQIDYFIETYPQRPGVTTQYIAGDDHEAWFQKDVGLSVGRYLEHRAREEGREDLVYLGYLEHDIEFRNEAGAFIVRIVHPGGGSAYALSYTPQKIVESYSGGEKPAVLIIGHYHKMEYIPSVRGVRVIQAGCTVDQSVWARKKRLAYHLGGWIVDLVQCPQSGACIGATVQDRTFFDRGFYQQWEY